MAVVYIHKLVDNHNPFYVGIGKDRSRAYSYRGRPDKWYKIVEKNLYYVHVIEEDVTLEKAYQIEEELVNQIGRLSLGTGPLTNLAAGGLGNSSYVRNIYQIKDNITVNIYKSIGHASRETGITSAGIGKCIRGIQKLSGGYSWKESVKRE